MEKFDRIFDYAVWIILLIFCFTALNLMVGMLLWGYLSKDGSLWWYAAHLALVALGIGKIAPLLKTRIVDAPREPPKNTIQGIMTGSMRGALAAGALLLPAGVYLLCSGSGVLQNEAARKTVGIIIVAGAVIGAFFRPVQITRRCQLWLIVALASLFFCWQFLSSAAMVLLSREFYYRSAVTAPEEYKLLDKQICARCLPAGAKEIEIRGIRGMKTRLVWRCEATEEQLKTFAGENGYIFRDNDTTANAFEPEKGSKMKKPPEQNWQAIFTGNGQQALPENFCGYARFSSPGVGLYMLYDKTKGILLGYWSNYRE